MPKKSKTLCVDDLRHAEYYGMQGTFDELYQKSQNGEVFENLMDLILSRDNILLAYRNIKANKGSYTAGTDKKNITDIGSQTPDDVVKRVRFIVTGSEHGYRPKPVRRKDIPKPNGKTRPLGIPCIWDRLIQQCIKQIMEPICEAKFCNNSYGFRPNRSVEHAINRTYTMLQMMNLHYVIEFDIKGFFDNVNHSKLIRQIWSLGIHDKTLIFIIKRILTAPIKMPDNTTVLPNKGTPQGGIISPILANIYLDKFDKYVNEYVRKFKKGKKHMRTKEYRRNEVELSKARIALKNANDDCERENAIARIRQLEKERVNIPPSDPMDNNYARLVYVRYADDWLCGVIGSKEDCKKIKEDFKNFLKEQLQLELSEEKTLITNAQKSAKFLSYEIRVRHSNLTKRDKTGKLVRNYTGRIVLEVSSDTIRKHLIDTGAMKLIYHNGKEIWKPKAIYRLKNCDDLEILDYYNSMIRGFYNYYCIANNSSIINSYKYIMEYSMYKTYGTKYRTSISKVIGKFRAGKDFAVKFRNSKGVEKMRVFYNEGFKRQKKAFQSNADLVPNTIKYFSSTKLIDRIKARECELCGKTNTPIEIHHVHRLKDLQGKTFWEALMIARNRKTIALCRECHKKLHCGQLN